MSPSVETGGENDAEDADTGGRQPYCVPDRGTDYGFVPVGELGPHEGKDAMVPPVGDGADNETGELRDEGDFFCVGDKRFSKDEVAYVAVEGVERENSFEAGPNRWRAEP